ncbi:MAG TPA: TfoX/Sxy family protein [Roseiflexaceae bacterium]|nr:TfoX/Sxy family protein [Roseiflexaceae bacterium]
MPVSSDYHTYVVEQLAAIPDLTSRRMFGGVGLYTDGVFFALIDDDTLYLKVDDGNRDDYIKRGCRPFQPNKNAPAMSYFSLPAEVIEDGEVLTLWARKAIAAGVAAAARQPRKKTSAKTRRTPARKSARR